MFKCFLNNKLGGVLNSICSKYNKNNVKAKAIIKHLYKKKAMNSLTVGCVWDSF